MKQRLFSTCLAVICMFVLATGLALLPGCASSPVSAQQMGQGLAANTAARVLATQQLAAGSITLERDQKLQATCDTVRLGIETAVALSMPTDPAQAAQVAASLAALQEADDKAKAADLDVQKRMAPKPPAATS